MLFRSKALLGYYDEVKQALQAQIDAEDASGHPAYVDNCDRIVQQMSDGVLDYQSPNGGTP